MSVATSRPRLGRYHGCRIIEYIEDLGTSDRIIQGCRDAVLGNTVYLTTPTLSVSFDHKRFTEPRWVEGTSRKAGQTEVRVPICDNHREKEVEKNLQEWLKSPVSLLFFRHLRRLHIANHEIYWQSMGPGPVPDILDSKRGKVRLLKPEELQTDWDPATDKRLTAWETVHQLIRVLGSGGDNAAAALVAKLGAKAETARELAYRLYVIAERKKRATEALAYNGLVQSWPEIVRLAQEGNRLAPAQAGLFESVEG
jgi:hypothetical protein